jgi:hypothetical protein
MRLDSGAAKANTCCESGSAKEGASRDVCYVGPEGPTHKTSADPEDLIEDLRQALA